MSAERQSLTLITKLEAVAYSESTSGSAAAHYFQVDPKRIREWRQKKGELERKGLRPVGCTKYIQVPDVPWNKIFKQKMHEYYDNWLMDDTKEKETSGGYMKDVSIEVLTELVKNAWDSISVETIKKSFQVCALTTSIDGEEDNQITWFKMEEPCHAGWDLLVNSHDLHVQDKTSGRSG